MLTIQQGHGRMLQAPFTPGRPVHGTAGRHGVDDTRLYALNGDPCPLFLSSQGLVDHLLKQGEYKDKSDAKLSRLHVGNSRLRFSIPAYKRQRDSLYQCST